MKTCAHCGSEFKAPPSHAAKRLTCSKPCWFGFRRAMAEQRWAIEQPPNCQCGELMRLAPNSRGLFQWRCSQCANRASKAYYAKAPPPPESWRRQSRELTDNYVKLILTKHSKLPRGVLSEDLVNLKREQLRLQRLAKEMQQAAIQAKEHDEPVTEHP